MSEDITPDNIASLIERIFPGMDCASLEQTVKLRIPDTYLPEVAAILDLVRHVPDELIPKEAQFEIVAITAAINAIVTSWIFGRQDRYLEFSPTLGNRHPIAMLRTALLRASLIKKSGSPPVEFDKKNYFLEATLGMLSGDMNKASLLRKVPVRKGIRKKRQHAT